MHYDSSRPSRIPPRVQAAQDFIGWFHSGRGPQPHISFEGAPRTEQPDPTPQEHGVYQAALGVLGMYFNGEMDYGDGPPMPPEPPEDEQPRTPVPIA